MLITFFVLAPIDLIPIALVCICTLVSSLIIHIIMLICCLYFVMYVICFFALEYEPEPEAPEEPAVEECETFEQQGKQSLIIIGQPSISNIILIVKTYYLLNSILVV